LIRAAWAVPAPALLHIHLHLHHGFHGPPFDYAGLAAAAAASWFGLPGPGEPVLIAAGILAARHQLDIGSVVVIAFAAAAVGGAVGSEPPGGSGPATDSHNRCIRSGRL
jgi:hypothetical protein